jgi:AAA15 family ATPase/GTPase
MKESILIRNFGPIKEIEIDGIHPFTVFIGESGSGKSTIMKVLVLFRWLYKMLVIRSYLKHANISKAPFKFDLKSNLNYNGVSDYIKPDSEIIYKKGNTILHYKNILRTSKLISKDELSLEKMAFIVDRRNLIPDILSKKVDVRDDFFLQETYGDFLLASEIIKELPIDYLAVKYLSKKESFVTKYYVAGTDSDYIIKLEEASSGMQTVIPLSLIVERFAKHYDFTQQFNQTIFRYMALTDSLKDFRTDLNIGDIKHRNIHIHIEEPELSLYPESQRSLIDFIVNRCFIQEHNDYNMTVMMATHSPYIINHLNLLIKAYDKNKPVNGASLNYDDISAYQVLEGKIVDLKIKNERLIYTNPLSDPINNIYEQYNHL